MKAVILAAGKGKRLHSEELKLPKCMVRADGRPLLDYVLDYTSFLPREDKIIVVGFYKEAIEAHLPGYTFAVQREQKGTGDAVMAAYDLLADYDGDVLGINGDMPLVREASLLALLELHRREGNDLSLIHIFLSPRMNADNKAETEYVKNEYADNYEGEKLAARVNDAIEARNHLVEEYLNEMCIRDSR